MARKVDNPCLSERKSKFEARRAFGNRLREWLKATGLKQSALCKIIDQDPGYMSRVIRGKQRPSVNLLADILVALYLRFKKQGTRWNALEVWELACNLGHEWDDVREAMAVVLSDHISEVQNEVLTWWDLARPRPARPRFPDVPFVQVKRATLEDLVSSITAMRDGYHPQWSLVVLWGAAGMGKTTLAYQVCQHPRVRETFLHGMVWLDQESVLRRGDGAGGAMDIEIMAAEACAQAGLSRREGASWLDTWQEWASLLRRRVLVVIDHVVDWEGLVPFLSTISPSAVVLLLTHKYEELAPQIGAHRRGEEIVDEGEIEVIQVKGFTPPETWALIDWYRTRYAKLPDLDQEALEALLSMTGGHPEAIHLAMHMAAREGWPPVLAYLAQGLGVRYVPVQKVLARQWEKLDTGVKESLVALLEGGVGDRAFGLTYASAVWEVSDERAESMVSQLVDTGLVEKVAASSEIWPKGKPVWRVLPVVWRARKVLMPALCVSRRVRVRAAWHIYRRERRALAMPWLLRVVVSAWWIIWIIPSMTLYLVLRSLATRLKKTWHLKWRSLWCLAPLEPRLFEKWFWRAGRRITEEEWLLYRWHQWWGDGWSALMMGALMFTVGIAMGWLPSQLTVGILISGPLFVVAYLAMAWLAAWRTWLAYLHGMETPDLKVMLRVAEWLGMWERPESTPSAESETQEGQGGVECSKAIDAKGPPTGSMIEESAGTV